MVLMQEKTSEQTYKLLGLPVCKIERNQKHKKKELLKFILSERVFENLTETKTLTISNKTIYKRVESPDYIDFSIPEIFGMRINKLRKTKKRLSKLVDSKYNKIFILKSNLGEAYMFLKNIINELITENDIVLIITNNTAHLELISMLGLDIDTLYVKSFKYEVNESIFSIGAQTFYVVFPLNFYIEAEKIILLASRNYPEIMYKNFGLTSNISRKFNRITISSGTQKSVNDYLIRNNIGKFVFIASQASTCQKIEPQFWENLQKELNLTVIKNSSDLELEDAYELASRSEAIITLRSGLSEILSDIDKPHFVIYTDFRQRYKFDELPKNRVLSGYSLKHYKPNNFKIYEIEYQKELELKIIKTIVNKIIAKEETYENYYTSRRERNTTWETYTEQAKMSCSG